MVEVPLIDVAGNEVSPMVTVILRQIVVLQVPSARTKYVVFVDGETVMLFPAESAVPPHEPEYHFQEAEWPRLPPVNPSVVLCPRQMVEVPVIAVAGTEESLTVTVTLRQMVLLQVPSALTKYVVVAAGATTKLLPVPTEVPPHEAVYHFQEAR